MSPLRTRICLLTLLSICCAHTALAAEAISVFVSVVPQKYFVEQIAGESVHVQVMVQPGASPATYEPKPKQMAALARAEAYFAIGVPFERVWLEKISAANPTMRVVHTDAGIEKRPMTSHHHHEAEDHAAEPLHSGEEESTGRDPHIWLSPPLVKRQAGTILAALRDLDPANGDRYQHNYQQFVTAIDALDKTLATTFAQHQGLRFMVFHPSWGYFAQAYGLVQVPIELEGKRPKPAQLQALIQDARHRGIKLIFVQPQFSTKSARLIAREIEGQVAVADPLAEDWITNLRGVAVQFKAALK